MSWHYSRALVEEYLQVFSLAGAQFAPLKETDTPETYCWRDKTTESLSLFQFGMTLQASTDDPGVELLTWYRADFLVRTLALREQCGDARALEVNGVVYGGRTSELLGRFNLPKFSVRTQRRSEQPDSMKLFTDLPASGMYAGGLLWELTPLDLIINASGFGSTLPTPSARDWKDTLGMGTCRKDGKTRLDRLPMLLFDHVRNAGMSTTTNWANMGAQTVILMDLAQITISGPDYCPELPEWAMGWPIGWTALEPLEMDKFQQWLLLHGKFLD